MKKTLLATAIAGALAASGAHAATVYNQDGTKLDLYGNVQIAYFNVNNADGDGEDEIGDNGSTFGFAAEHVINSGLTGYMKLEFDDFQADEIKIAGRDAGDQAYFGLKGNFGDVRLGSYDPLIDDWVQDKITNNQAFDVNDSSSFGIANVGTNDREGDKLTFTSPSFSGFQFALGTQYKGDAEETEFTGTLDGADTDQVASGLPTGQFTGNVTHTVEADSDASFFGGVKYTAGAFYVAAVYDDLANYDGKITGINGTVEAADGTTTTVNEDNLDVDVDLGDQWGIAAQYTFDTLRLAAKYERFESDNDLTPDVDFYGVSAYYGYGMGDVYAAYQYIDEGGSGISQVASDALDQDQDVEFGDDNYNEVILGATYNLSDAMYVWTEYALRDQPNDENDGFGVGATYLF